MALVSPRRASSRSEYVIFPKPGIDLSNPESFAPIGMTVTGMPALLTSADLPLRGFAGRFKN